jgi:GNAT superfamily N-acetyltransferase
MKDCSISGTLQILPGTLDDYRQLAHYHYRDSRPGPVAAIFALKPAPKSESGIHAPAVGVIVYSMPVPEVELRDVATAGFFAGFDRSTKCALLNAHIRCITRLIIDPRFRGLGLASRLIRETMPRLGVAIIEAMAVMGLVNPFLERAGMTAYRANVPVRTVRLVEAFSSVGIEDRQLIDPAQVQQSIDRLGDSEGQFIELEIRRFLQSYNRCRDMPPSLKRTRYVLSRLTTRPVYYIWFNREKGQESRVRWQD